MFKEVKLPVLTYFCHELPFSSMCILGAMMKETKSKYPRALLFFDFSSQVQIYVVRFDGNVALRDVYVLNVFFSSAQATSSEYITRWRDVIWRCLVLLVIGRFLKV